MAPKSDHGDNHTDSGASCPADNLDPPPPPDHSSDTPEQKAHNDEEMDEWLDRNIDYLRSFDSRGLQHLPLLSCLWGYDYPWYTSKIIYEVAELSSWAGRRPTPEELSIFTSHTARGVVAASYDRPIAIGATAFALWHGWYSYRMPFYQPRFVRFMHPQATRLPIFSSLAWHSARVGAYGLLGLTAYELLAERYRTYMINSFTTDALNYESGLEQMGEDINNNLDRLDREREARRGRRG